MSLEKKLDELTQAVNKLTAIIESVQNFTVPVPVQPVAETPSPVPFVQASVIPPSPAASASTAPVMPELPTFIAPPSPVATPKVPFSDSKGLIEYVMAVYKSIGAAKGAEIQNILVSLGYQNINDVKPESYEALFNAVEKLK